MERRRLEAERDLAKANGESGLSMNLSATVGVSNRADELSNLYNNVADRETFRLGLSIPVFDGGRRKALTQKATVNQKLINYSVAQEKQNFRQEIFKQVRQLKTLRNQLETAKESESLAKESYDITKERYISGSLSLNDLNLALDQKDRAIRDYLTSLSSFWIAYYNLRYLTLYDFVNDESLLKPQY